MRFRFLCLFDLEARILDIIGVTFFHWRHIVCDYLLFLCDINSYCQSLSVSVTSLGVAKW